MPDPKLPKPEDIELHSDAWARFERFVKGSARKAPAPVKKTAKKRPKAARKA